MVTLSIISKEVPMRPIALALTLGCVSPLCLSAQTARDFLGAPGKNRVPE